MTATCVTATGVITITFRHVGARGNACTLRYDVDTSVTGVTFAVSGATLASGSGNDSLTNALATAATSLYDLIAVAQSDTTNL